jgi:hemerythrin-like domain-containing protein
LKRDPALLSLSHDHHHALFVAQKLRRATAETASDARAAFLEFWNGPGQAHFRTEEQVLLPAYAGHGDPSHPLVARALCEHVEIRHRAREVGRNRAAGAAELNALGERLGAHVRLEERDLFPLIERTMPASELRALAGELQRAEAAERSSAQR